MNMVNELNGEMAMAIVDRMKSEEKVDRQAILSVIRQVQTTLRSLSKSDRREKAHTIHKANALSNGIASGTH